MVLNVITSETFVAKDGRKVILRQLKWDDLDDCIEFINSLVEDGSDIALEKKVSRHDEADWLGKRLASMEKGEIIDIVAEVDGKMIANAEVGFRRGYMSHVGDLGIGIRSGYRGIGIGTELMKKLIAQSKMAGLSVVVLSVMETNKTARQLYEKAGFRESGRIPKGILKNGKYIDLIHMTREL